MKIKNFSELSVDELYSILALRSEVFVVEQNCPYQDLDFKDQHSHHLLNKIDDRLVGYLRIIKEERDSQIWIGRVLVSKSFRGRGIAEEMLREAISYRRLKYPQYDIHLSAQTYAKKLYENAGFTPIGEEYLEDDIPHIHMFLKSLSK